MHDSPVGHNPLGLALLHAVGVGTRVAVGAVVGTRVAVGTGVGVFVGGATGIQQTPSPPARLQLPPNCPPQFPINVQTPLEQVVTGVGFGIAAQQTSPASTPVHVPEVLCKPFAELHISACVHDPEEHVSAYAGVDRMDNTRSKKKTELATKNSILFMNSILSIHQL